MVRLVSRPAPASEPGHRGVRLAGDAPCPGVARVEQEVPVFGQVARELALGLRHGVLCLEQLEVPRADVRYDAGAGARDLRAPLDVARLSRPHRDEQARVSPAGSEDGERQADLVVEAPLGGADAVVPRQYRDERIFGAGLSGRA